MKARLSANQLVKNKVFFGIIRQIVSQNMITSRSAPIDLFLLARQTAIKTNIPLAAKLNGNSQIWRAEKIPEVEDPERFLRWYPQSPSNNRKDSSSRKRSEKGFYN